MRKRLEEVPAIRFFTDAEVHTLAAVAGRIVPQPDRDEAEKIPVVQWIDEKLYEGKRAGYRYEELPPPREAWRLGLAGIDEAARGGQRRLALIRRRLPEVRPYCVVSRINLD